MTQTIHEAISQVLRAAGKPLSSKQIYEAIVAQNLYAFHTEEPRQVVTAQLRRRCENLHFPSSSRQKYFRLTENGLYALASDLNEQTPPVSSRSIGHAESNTAFLLAQLKRTHADYVSSVRKYIRSQIAKLAPTAFERFARHLLNAYGFRDVHVTRPSRDGGIDGFGRLPVGMTHLNVAFQCKNWRTSVGRPEVDRFRGAIQGRYEQGILFTTSTFTKEALNVSLCPGAVPVILFGGDGIAEIMVEKQFGVTNEYLALPIPALDQLLDEL